MSDDARPSKRKRVALACTRCRERKVRCDGEKPVCSQCQAREPSPLPCCYTVILSSAKIRSAQEYIAGLQQQLAEYQRNLPKSGADIPATSAETTSSFAATNQTITHMLGLDPAEDPSVTIVAHQAQTLQNLPQLQADIHRQGNPVSMTSDGGTPETSQTSASVVISATPTSRTFGQGSVQHGHDNQLDQTHDIRSINAMGAATLGPTQRSASTREYYGQSSIVSLMQEISPPSQSVQPHTDQPTSSLHQATHVANVHRGVRGSAKDILFQARFALPPRFIAEKLLDIYFGSVHIFYPWVHSITFREEAERLWSVADSQPAENKDMHNIGLGGSKCPPTVFFCALNAMFALGCEFSDIVASEKEELSCVFSERMKDFLQVEILDSGSIAHVQALLLAGQYLFCTQYPMQCWNVIGLACRMAVGIGLHSDAANDGNITLENQIRRRVWYGCLQMDLNVSMTLGRPPMLNAASKVPLPSPIDDTYLLSDSSSCKQPQEKFAIATFAVENMKLARILGRILDGIYHSATKNKLDPKEGNGNSRFQDDFNVIMQLDSSLKEFVRCLPEKLHWEREANDNEKYMVMKRQRNVLHARFLHLKILLYRPSFSGYAFWAGRRKQLKDKPQVSRRALSQLPDMELSTIIHRQCAVACVESACQLVHSIDKAITEHATGAWWWILFYLTTSAVILVLAESTDAFSDDFNQTELQNTWQICIRSMESLSATQSRAKDHLQFLRDWRQRVFESQSKAANSRARTPDNNAANDAAGNASQFGRSASALSGHVFSAGNLHHDDQIRSAGGHTIDELDTDFDWFAHEIGLDTNMPYPFGTWETGIENIPMPPSLFHGGDFG